MEKRNCMPVRATLTCVCCLAFFCCAAQKGSSLLIMNVPLQYAWYKVNVLYGVAEIRGEKKNQSINTGAGVRYEYFLKDKLSVESGVDVFSVSYKIVRPFERLFWNDLQRPVRVTYPKYKYSLLRLPLRVNYRFAANHKLQCFVGLSNNLGFTFRQFYAEDSKLSKWYFFSNTVELNMRLRLMLHKNFSVSVEPNVQVYNQWKKDLVLSEYGINVLEKPEGITHYYNRFFDAVGISLSAAYKF